MLISRRGVMIGAGAAMGAFAARPVWAQEGEIVETAQGRVQGLRANGVSIFRGMRYGANTAETGRFLPPQPPKPWTGTHEAFEFKDQSPQAKTFLADPNVPMTDDCLRINVWTPAADERKRPVMLWFHGGGFEAGVGSSDLYEGTNIAKRGDVVVATINHRLNVFGHCYLADVLGEDFAESGNVGYLDLVRAMEWVKENIARFGGDPDNVMIYGQSGGGRKVSLCYAGHDAAGLFGKGAVQSGAHLRIYPIEYANSLTHDLLNEVGLDRTTARQLQSMDIEKLSAAQRKVIARAGARFSPVLDGNCFFSHPFYPEAPAISSNVPMLLGTTRTELSNQLGSRPGIFDMDEAQAKTALKPFLNEEDVDEAYRTFLASRPQASPSEVFFTIASARGYVRDQTIMAEMRAAGATAPTYVYRLMWRQPVEGGRRVSQHSLDLPFMFDNVEAGARMTGPPTDSTRAMANAMAESWIAFARTGNPNNAAIPDWKPYDLQNRYVMMLDVPPHLESDPQKAERLFMDRYETQQMQSGVRMHRRGTGTEDL